MSGILIPDLRWLEDTDVTLGADLDLGALVGQSVGGAEKDFVQIKF